jgi:malate dehydrogenase (quinone)
MEDWQLATAGQRVQIIKRDSERTGRLQFGTEVVTAADGSLAALLGASPGASTAVPVMLDLLQKCFPERTSASVYQCALRNMIPSLGHDLTKNAKVLSSVRDRVDSALGLSLRPA